MTITPENKAGTVYLVGAGPGDPGLLSIRAVECLGRADLVLYDYLANPVALEHASASAELICLGNHRSGRTLSQDEIVARMLEGSRAGKTVVRLKGGDPSIFGRGADEIIPLREAKVPFEIVPGITAGIAVAAYCEIPITHHDDASAVALITGQERHAKAESSLDYGALARFPGTLIFYMGVRRAGIWSRALIDEGKPPETPVAIVRWCARSQQQMVRCTLGTVAEVVASRKLLPPSLFVVGNVVDRAPDLSWFASRPLFGRRVLVAGSPSTSRDLRVRLSELGAEVISQPAIQLTDPGDWAPVDAALEKLGEYDWLVFSSKNGVDRFFGRLFDRGGDARRLGSVKLAAVGSGSAKQLGRYGLKVDLVPEEFCAESLAQALAGEARGKRFLLARAGRGRHVLADELQRAGGQVDQIVVYDSVDVDSADPDVAAAMSAGDIDWVTVTSSATAKSLARLYGDALRQTRLASISPLTSSVLKDLGYDVAAEALPHTMAGLTEAILAAGQADG